MFVDSSVHRGMQPPLKASALALLERGGEFSTNSRVGSQNNISKWEQKQQHIEVVRGLKRKPFCVASHAIQTLFAASALSLIASTSSGVGIAEAAAAAEKQKQQHIEVG
jgi:hypothetical protein